MKAIEIEVIGVRRSCADKSSHFHLCLNGKTEFSIDFNKIKWAIDNSVEKTTAVIRKEWHRIGKDSKRLYIKEITISGPQSQIECLMETLGIGTTNKSAIPSSTEEEFDNYLNDYFVG